MALPVLPKATFVIKSKYLPKGRVELVPFTVGQESILLQVKDSKDSKDKLNALRQIIGECVRTPNFDIGAVPLFVLEETFLRLREKSIGEVMPFTYMCHVQVPAIDKFGVSTGEKQCNTPMELKLDLRQVKLIEQEGHDLKVMITDEIGVKFRHPTLDSVETIPDGSVLEADMIISSIECIFDADSVYKAEDETHESLLAWYNDVPLHKKAEIYQKFMYTQPHLHYGTDIKCPSCGHVHRIEFNSLNELFS